MLRVPGPSLSLLALLILAGAAEASAGEPLTRAALRAQQSARAEVLGKALAARQQELGLPDGTGFQVLGKATDTAGRTHVRFQQTYKGVPVWKARALGHAGADGSVLGFQADLAKGLSLEVAPAKTQGEAHSRVLADLGVSMLQQRIPARSSLVVVPNAKVGGFRFKRDAATHRIVLDEEFSHPLKLDRQGYTLAYHVKVSFLDSTKGAKSLQYLVDANTGSILDKWDATYHSAPVGTGHSQYSGTVSLNTKYDGVSTYTLQDTTRGSVAHPNYSFTGNQTFWVDANLGFNSFTSSTNEWGDGLNYDPINAPDSTNGQTAGVDAHYGAQISWDMYLNVFGRDGIDDAGTSVANFVHMYLGSGYDNAFWDSNDFSMNYGDGTEFTVLTCLDVAAHEMSHGVMDSMASLDYAGESGGLNEANSDIMGTMAEFYGRGGGTGSTIPDTATNANWLLGEQIISPPLRYMYKPSLDGYSYDYWFGGVGTDDVHYSSGVGNRFFYFLSQGTGAGSYASDYLPGGMTGIGNQKAAEIWYTAMRDYVASTSADYAAVRTATLDAAVYLGYTSSSDEYAAVENAWAAVNVGAAHVASAPVRVQFTNNFLSNGYWGNSAMVMLPLSATFTFGVSVTNATDSTVTWATGATGPMLSDPTYRLATAINSSGVLTTPSSLGAFNYGMDQVKATSNEDSSQFAANLVLIFDCDMNGDGSVDAFDLAPIAVHYGTAAATGDVTNNGSVNDNDVAAFGQAFQNAYGQ